MTHIARACVFILLMSFSTVPNALSQTPRVFKLPADEFPQKQTWWDSIYLFPDFQEGRVTFFTDFSPDQSLLLNYNLYYGQMEMINSLGDTLEMKPLKTIKFVQVGSDAFYFEAKKGYLHVLSKGEVTLAARTLFYLTKAKYTGGKINNEDIEVRGRPTAYEKTYVQRSVYYFIDKSGKSYPTSKSTLVKLFPEHKDAIKDYINIRSTTFYKEQDLMNITEFCNSLRRNSSNGAN